MPRIRTIKPEFCTSEQIGECSPTARLLFVELWMFCDDAGRHPASPLRAKAECFPFDSFSLQDMQGFVSELVNAGLLKEYEYEGQRYWQVTGWKHQKIERPSYKFPPLDEAGVAVPIDSISTTPRRTFDDTSTSPRPRKGRESKGEEGKGENTLSADRGRREYPEEFETFWTVYPKQRRTKKQEALRRWKQALRRVDAETLIRRAMDYAASDQGRSEYAVMPSVWLHNAMWEDDAAAWSRSTPRSLGAKLGASAMTLDEMLEGSRKGA